MYEYEEIEGKPEGVTIFEVCYRGGYAYHETGFILYDDGKVYYIDRGPGRNGFSGFIDTNERLVSDVKSLIEDNRELLKSLPECFDDWSSLLIDGGVQQYKFLDFRFYGETMNLPGTENIELLRNKIVRLFRKHKVFVPEIQESLYYFICDLNSLINGIVDGDDDSYEEFFKNGDFGESCRYLGFELNDNQGQTPVAEDFDKMDDFLLLGDKIYSQWNYLKNVCENPKERFDAEWFKAALARLKELGGPTDFGVDRNDDPLEDDDIF